MSFTRFYDDPNRIEIKNLETSAMNSYVFNVPGNTDGMNLYFSDPHIRMQKTGSHLNRNLLDVETELRNINIPLNRDNINLNNYKKNQMPKTTVPIYDVKKNITKESRASHPAWLYRESSQYRPDYLFLNPQEHIKIPFIVNQDTNILEKDYYNLKTYKKI